MKLALPLLTVAVIDPEMRSITSATLPARPKASEFAELCNCKWIRPLYLPEQSLILWCDEEAALTRPRDPAFRFLNLTQIIGKAVLTADLRGFPRSLPELPSLAMFTWSPGLR